MRHPCLSLARRLAQALPLVTLCLVPAALLAAGEVPIRLSGAAEVPPVTTSATATGHLVVRPDRSITGSFRTIGLVPTVAHIHEAGIGSNGPPIITLTRTAEDSFVVPAGTHLSEVQYTSYTAGNLYINVHSEKYPDGEIRGQLPGKPMRLAN